MQAKLAQYEQFLYEKRREASQATLDAFFSKASLPDARRCQMLTTQMSSNFAPPPPPPPSKQGLLATFGECYYIIFVFENVFYLHLLFMYFKMSILITFLHSNKFTFRRR